MEKLEGIEIAKSYRKHAEKRKEARTDKKFRQEAYHEGCMAMALQIFESCDSSHGLGTMSDALEKI